MNYPDRPTRSPAEMLATCCWAPGRTQADRGWGLSRGALWTLVAAALVVLVAAFAQIDDRPVTKDAAQNLRMAVNLAHHGVMSLDPRPPFRPSMYREPLPIFTMAGAVYVVDAIEGRAALEAYNAAPRAGQLKLLNLVWILLLFFALCVALLAFTANVPLTLIASFVAVRPFLSSIAVDGVDDFFTELPAAALLAGSSALLALAMRRPSLPLSLAIGAGFALLTLTKAAFLYVSMVMIVLIAVGLLRAGVSRYAWSSAALGIALFSLLVGSWMLRNWVEFDRMQISERGGLAVFNRALLTEMSAVELRGSFYAWARPSLQPLIGAALGFEPSDLKRGGRLQRLNDDLFSDFSDEDRVAEIQGDPSRALSFYRRARAERVALSEQFEREGNRDAMLAADEVLQKKGLALIETHPGRNLALIGPFLWRSAPITFPLLLASAGLAWVARRVDVGAYVAPALGVVVLSASITYFLPRFEHVPHPIGIAGAAILIQSVLLWIWGQRTGAPLT